VAVLGANGQARPPFFAPSPDRSGPTVARSHTRVRRSLVLTLRRSFVEVSARCPRPAAFPGMSVQDNLIVGSSGRRDRRESLTDDIAYAYELFPILGSGADRRRARFLVGSSRCLPSDVPSSAGRAFYFWTSRLWPRAVDGRADIRGPSGVEQTGAHDADGGAERGDRPFPGASGSRSANGIRGGFRADGRLEVR